jgi:hypothetical protein
MGKLVYQTSPVVTFGTNEFVNVPTLLQFDDTPLVSVAKEQDLVTRRRFHSLNQQTLLVPCAG